MLITLKEGIFRVFTPTTSYFFKMLMFVGTTVAECPHWLCLNSASLFSVGEGEPPVLQDAAPLQKGRAEEAVDRGNRAQACPPAAG